jgi:hypothetical protein
MRTVLAQVSTTRAILIGVGAGILVLVVAVALLSARRRRAAGPDIPSGMRPGPSDADLEKPMLERLYAWGVVSVLFMGIWIPVLFLAEPDTNREDTIDMVEESVERGRHITQEGGEENPMGFNCERCHGVGLTGGQNVFNESIVAVPDLTTVCGGAAAGHPAITSLQDVVDTIAQGREGTDMPSWSVRFAGAMHDQQINDVVNYILSIQEVPEDQNICLNPAAGGGESPTPAASPTPAPTETGE